MRSRSLWFLLALAACGKSGEPAATTTTAPPAATDSPDGASKDTAAMKAAAAAKAALLKKKLEAAKIVDTGAVASPQSLVRETYGYSFTSMSRDPFRALTVTAVEGPELPELKLIGLIYNHTDPKQSLATFRDVANKKDYNVRAGDHIGRILVVSIDTNGALLRVNDFGTVREQPYTLRKEDGN